MTKRVTVSLPDDVARYLEAADNASAVVADALRAQMHRAATTEAMLRAAGFDITREAERARPILPPLTAEQRAEIDRRRQMLRSAAGPDTDPAA